MSLIGAALFVVVLLVACVGAEVNPKTFFAHVGNFVSYFDRLLTLDSGKRVWTDIPEWFWGLRKWLADARRDAADQLCRHAARDRVRVLSKFPRGREHLAGAVAAFRRAAAA